MLTEQLTKPLTETDRAKLLTALRNAFPGICSAMADQWSNPIIYGNEAKEGM